MTISIYGAVGITLLVLLFVKIIPTLVKPWFSPLNQLPGPPNPSWVHGHFKERFTDDNLLLQEKWIEEYGNIIALKAAFGVRGTARSRRPMRYRQTPHAMTTLTGTTLVYA